MLSSRDARRPTMRRIVMRGETAADDYVVIWDDLRIGRIYKTGRRLERFRTVKPARFAGS